MTINSEAEGIAKVSIESEHIIQKICLRDYDSIKARLPKSVKIRLLSYNGDHYKWTPVVEVEHLEKKSLYDLYKCKQPNNYPRAEVPCPRGMVPEVPVIPEGLVTVKRVTFSSYVMGLSVLDRYKDYRVKWCADGVKENSYNIRSYLNNKNKLTKYNPKLYSDRGFDFPVRDIIDDINGIVMSLLKDKDYWPAETYFYLLLTHNWGLAPVVLSNLMDLKIFSARYPQDLNAMLYLKYGNRYQFGFNELYFEKRNARKMCDSINLTLEDDYLPVLLYNDVPIRWKNE